MSRVWRWGRFVATGLVFAILVWRLGTSPFLTGLRTVSGGALAAAAGLTAVANLCCAWRWRIVSAGFGLRLSPRAAFAAYYRSVFLNLSLPGGVVGDAHRAISHGRDVSDIRRALEAVVCERFAGQIVQVLLTVVVLFALPSPVRADMPWVAIAVIMGVSGAFGALRLYRARGDGGKTTSLRVPTRTRAVRGRVLTRRAWPPITLASALVVASHAATFLIAARTAGVTAPLSRMLPIALLVMAAMVLPSVGGWGPREGVTAWAFGAAGLGAQRGVATAVAYGVMVLGASLPGAAVIGLAWFHRHRLPERTPVPLWKPAADA